MGWGEEKAKRGQGKWASSQATDQALDLLPPLAWVSGVSGEKGKDGSEKGREPLPPPPSKISSPLALRKAWYSGYPTAVSVSL